MKSKDNESYEMIDEDLRFFINFINHPNWNQQGYMFFGNKTPKGIKELRKNLNAIIQSKAPIIKIKEIIGKSIKRHGKTRRAATYTFYNMVNCYKSLDTIVRILRKDTWAQQFINEESSKDTHSIDVIAG